MKNNLNQLAILAVLLMIAFSSNGQSDKTRIDENIFGIIVGGTFSNISNYDAKESIGFQAGLYWEWKFSEKFSAMSNILYTERGAKGNGNLPNIKLGYLIFPAMLKYNISDKVGIATGIAWDALVSANGDGIRKSDFKDDDWRIPITLGYHISENLAIGINYNFGLSDITRFDDESLKNNWASISLAYLFNKKK